MNITLQEQKQIQIVINNYFKDIGENETIKEIKVYQSDSFINISIYPESSVSLSVYDVKILTKKLTENNPNLKHITDLVVINFDIQNKCVTLSLDFS